MLLKLFIDVSNANAGVVLAEFYACRVIACFHPAFAAIQINDLT